MTSSKTSTGPSKAAMPYLKAGSNALTDAFNSNAGNVSNITGILNNNIPSVLGSTLNNPALSAASSYDQNILGSNADPTQNPLFMNMLKGLNGTTTDAVNGAIGTRGLAGGSAQTQLLTDQLGKVDNNALLSQYNTNVAGQQAAASNATSVAGAQSSGIQSLLAYLSGTAALPGDIANQYATGQSNLWGKSTTTTQSPSLLSSILGIAGAGASIAGAI